MGLRRSVIFLGDNVAGAPLQLCPYLQGNIVSNFKTNGMPWICGGSQQTGTYSENRWCGSAPGAPYTTVTYATIRAQLLRDGPQWPYDTVLTLFQNEECVTNYNTGTPTTAQIAANINSLLDTVRAQQPGCRVFFNNMSYSATVAANNYWISTINPLIASTLAARADAALISLVDIHATTTITPTTVGWYNGYAAALTAAGY